MIGIKQKCYFFVTTKLDFHIHNKTVTFSYFVVEICHVFKDAVYKLSVPMNQNNAVWADIGQIDNLYITFLDRKNCSPSLSQHSKDQ